MQSARFQQSILISAILATVIALLCHLYDWPHEVGPRGAPGSIGPVGPPPTQSIDLAAPLTGRPIVERIEVADKLKEGVAPIHIVIRSGQTGDPIAQAAVHRGSSDRLRRVTEASRLATADANGKCVIEMPTTPNPALILVTAVGFTARDAVLPKGVTNLEIKLWPSSQVFVRTLDELGNPLSDVLVMVGSGVCPLPMRDLISFDKDTETFGSGLLGNSEAPLAFSISNQAGEAVVEGLPPGTYALSCFKRGWWFAQAQQPVGTASPDRIIVDGPRHDCVATMSRLYVAALANPPSGECVCAYGAPRLPQLPFGARSTALETWIREQFPGVLWLGIGCHRDGEAPTAEVHVFSRARGWILERARYMPLSTFHPTQIMPVGQEAATRLTGRLTVRIVDAEGRVHPAENWIAIEEQGLWTAISTASNETEVPPGVYTVKLPSLKCAKSLDVAVQSGNLCVVELRAPKRLVRLNVHVTTYDAAAFPNCTVRVTEMQSGNTLASFLTSGVECTMLIPHDRTDGEVIVKCSSSGLRGEMVATWSADGDSASARVVMAR